MKVLSVVGTPAMFLVGGGIIAHGPHFVSHVGFLVASSLGGLGSFGLSIVSSLYNAAVGFVVGVVVWCVLKPAKRWV